MSSSGFNREDISQFYDDFLQSRMLHYRIYGNKRIELAQELVQPYIRSDSQIVEIGCGIGIVTEQMALAASQGTVWACDLSEKNIWYAKKTLKPQNIQYMVIDILQEFERLQTWVSTTVDLIVMVDVLEHLPLSSHQALFENFSQMLNPNGKIILTFPSEHFQSHIREQQPEELQPIEEVITLAHLLQIAQSTDLTIQQYALVDVWMTNQYVHCVFFRSEDATTFPIEELNSNYLMKILQYVRSIIKHKILIPRRRRKYIQSVFDSLEG